MGIANEFSLAADIARLASKEGATLAVSHLPDSEKGPPRVRRRVEKSVEGLNAPLILPCDVQQDESIAAFFAKVKSEFGSIDFLVHSIAYAPIDDINGPTIAVSRSGFQIAMDVSVFSFLAVSRHASSILNHGGSVLTLTYFGGEKVVGGYNLMGLCKAALESATRYAAYDLGENGIRVNALSAGPVKTLAASAVGEIDSMLGLYEAVSPLQRNISGEEVARSALYLLSDLSSGVSGEVHHCDGGYHAMGSPGRGAKKVISTQG